VKTQNIKRKELVGVLLCTMALLMSSAHAAHALTFKVSPQGAQPGDVLTLTIWPHPGEKIKAVGMAAFDTPRVKFYARRDGSVRGYLGYPFDRSSGTFELQARVQFEKDGKPQEQVVSTSFTGHSRHFPTQRITMHNSNASKMSKRDLLRKEKAHVQSKMQSSYPAPLWSGNWIVPCRGASTSAYGRKRTINGKWWGQHSGADIRASYGTPVHASNSGRVVLSEYLPTLRGNCIVVDHGCNIFSVYMHLSKRLVKEGETVSKGEEIGKVGATGFVTGPHLHWEIRIGWEPMDPFKFARSGVRF
jgi:murein DD-endopeptidase MepM/ murein hydrolase activator NlpD